MSRWFGSVRARVTGGAVLIVGFVLVLVGVATLLITARGMVRDAQAAAEVQARNLAVVAQAGRVDPVLAVDSSGNTILQVVDLDGTVMARSPQLQDIPALSSVVPSVGSQRAMTVRVEDLDGDAVDYRVVAIGTPSPTGPLTAFAGVSLEEGRDTLDTLGGALLGGSALVLLVVAGATWWVTGRALRPVENIRKEVDGLTDAELDRRVTVPTHRDEVRRLAVTMNRMLSRLESSRQLQQAFVADAAHELRSPLASLRTSLEVTIAHPGELTVTEVAQDALEDTERLETLAVDLLRLARLDAGEAPPTGPVDVGVEVSRILEGRFGERIPVHYDPPSNSICGESSPQILNQVVTNLVDNATRHARENVWVRVVSDRARVSVTVSDDGPGVPNGEEERIFQRFIRLDDARSRDDGGTGLGLAIARDLARATGGDVVLKPQSHGNKNGATFRFTLPTT